MKVAIFIALLIALAGIVGIPVVDVGQAILILGIVVGGFGVMFVGLRKMAPWFGWCFAFFLGLVVIPPVAKWTWAKVLAWASGNMPALPAGSPAPGSGLPHLPWSNMFLSALLLFGLVLALIFVGRLTLALVNRRLEAWWRGSRTQVKPSGRERAELLKPDQPMKYPEPSSQVEIDFSEKI